MSKISPARFVREVRQETSKVAWPTRKETTVTVIMVFIFVVIAALFFLLVDGTIAWTVRNIMGW